MTNPTNEKLKKKTNLHVHKEDKTNLLQEWCGVVVLNKGCDNQHHICHRVKSETEKEKKDEFFGGCRIIFSASIWKILNKFNAIVWNKKYLTVSGWSNFWQWQQGLSLSFSSIFWASLIPAVK